MEEKEKIIYVATIANMTERLKYYGNADINRISFYKLALKYRSSIREKDKDKEGVSLRRKLDLIIKKIETECQDIVKIT